MLPTRQPVEPLSQEQQQIHTLHQQQQQERPITTASQASVDQDAEQRLQPLAR